MSVTAHRTEQVGQRAVRVPVQRTTPADPVVSPPRRVRVHGYVGPPARRRVAGAPRVVASAACRPRQRISVLSLLAVGASVCLVVVGLGTLAGAGAAEVPTRTEVVWVRSGETLSELAARMAPSSDQAAVVDRIRELNSGVADGVRPGQPLRVPSEG
ncbi:LysM peptidoglycan-binding domain-containing protein [Actinophytocola sediminis]